MENNNDLIASVFDNQAESWDTKKRFVTYYGAYSSIKSEIFSNISNGMTIADIGCGTGKIISSIDNKIINGNLLGLDLSKKMIGEARKRVLTGKNEVNFAHGDFLSYPFNNKMFDIIIFSYVLHHINDSKEALIKAKKILTTDGKIIFSIPGISYLSEIFDNNSQVGRYDLKTIDTILNLSGLFPLVSTRNCFKMVFNSFDDFIKYLKSIGTYQKVIGYSNDSWNKQFLQEVYMRFRANKYISGEYLTYTCVDKNKMLLKK